MGNTDLTRFDYKREGYRLSVFEGDLVVVNDPLLGPDFTAPLTYIVMEDDERKWVLKHAFLAKAVPGYDDEAYIVTGRDQALTKILKIEAAGRVNLMHWDVFQNVVR